MKCSGIFIADRVISQDRKYTGMKHKIYAMNKRFKRKPPNDVFVLTSIWRFTQAL